MRAAIYARVSTEKQDAANQIPALEAYCAAQGFKLVKRYQDTCSGSTSTRIAFQTMLDHARLHRFDVLVFWSLDRLSREGVLKTLQHLAVLSESGIKWHSLQEPYIDTLGPFGDAVVGIIATIAEMERARLRERTKAGLERARAEGKQLGRRAVIVDVDKARKLIAEGVSMRGVAKNMGVSAATVAKRVGAAG